jgi:hypothetical protein
MALTIGDFTANLSINDEQFKAVLGEMQKKFDEAKGLMLKSADEWGAGVSQRLSAAHGPVVGTAANIGIQAATALGGGLLSILSGPVIALLGQGIQAGLNVALGFISDNFQPALAAVSGFITGTVVPAFQSLGNWIAANKTPIMIVGGTLLTFFLPALIQVGIQAAIAAAGMVVSFAQMAAGAVASGATAVGAWIAMSAQATWSAAKSVAAGVAAAFQWGVMGWAALASAAQTVAAWVMMTVAGETQTAQFIAQVATKIAGWVSMGVAALAAAAQVVAGWLMMGVQAAIAVAEFVAQVAVTIAQWVLMGLSALATAAQVVAAWVMMGVESLIAGAKMAAAWLLAMGPIPLIIAAVVALVALIIANWDTIVAWTKAAFQAIWDFLVMVWNAIVAGIQVAINGVIAAIGWLGRLPGMVIGWFGSIAGGAVGKLGELLSWLGGLPGMILGALGNLGNLLLDVGRSILEGLWNGIKNAATWIKDKIIGLIQDIIPGPIKSILGINSPSKVAAELGRWVPLGLAQGIEQTSGAVARASTQLAGLVASRLGDLATVQPRALAFAGAGFAADAPRPDRAVVHIENFYATPSQTPADIAGDLDWMSRGGG